LRTSPGDRDETSQDNGNANRKTMAVERPGRNPVLIAFERAIGDSPTNRILPGGWGSHYLRAGYFASRK
jgi:hypothetical protein